MNVLWQEKDIKDIRLTFSKTEIRVKASLSNWLIYKSKIIDLIHDTSECIQKYEYTLRGKLYLKYPEDCFNHLYLISSDKKHKHSFKYNEKGKLQEKIK